MSISRGLGIFSINIDGKSGSNDDFSINFNPEL